MVAETHSHGDDATVEDLARFVAVELAGLADDVDLTDLTLGDCGFELTLDFVELTQVLGEEFGERTLAGGDIDEVDATTGLIDFVAEFYAHGQPRDRG